MEVKVVSYFFLSFKIKTARREGLGEVSAFCFLGLFVLFFLNIKTC